MATDPLHETGTARHRTAVSPPTVALFALLVTLADGYWATSLRGATGYIQDTQQPFRDWLLYLAVMLPIVAGTVLAALWIVCRLARAGTTRFVAAAALVVVLTTLVGTAQMALTAVYDYRSQVQQETLMHHIHNPDGVSIRLDSGATVPAGGSACTGLCAQKQLTIAAHVRGVRLGALLLLVTNGVLVLWALAFRGGRIWIPRGTDGTEPSDQLAVI